MEDQTEPRLVLSSGVTPYAHLLSASLRKDGCGAGGWEGQGDHHHSDAHSPAPSANGSRNLNRKAEHMQVPSSRAGRPASKQTNSQQMCPHAPGSDCRSGYTCFGKAVTLKPGLM